MNLKNRIFLLSVLMALIFLCSLGAFGQNEPDKSASSNQQNQSAIDKNFDLNIAQDRITETDFKRSTSVALNSAESGGLRVEVGVGVRAQNIDVILRGIFGHVRFRASFELLRQKIEQLQTVGAPNPSAPKKP